MKMRRFAVVSMNFESLAALALFLGDGQRQEKS